MRMAGNRLYGLMALLLIWAASVRASADDWPRWRGPLANGHWPTGRIPGRFPEGGLKVAWRVDIGPGFSGVAVAAGRVYTMERRESRKEERIVCRSAETGKLLWEYAYRADYGDMDHGKGPRATPTVHEGRVYTLGAVGHLCCFDAATGFVIWKRDLRKELGARVPTWGFSASPVLYGDTVIVHTALQPGGCYAAFDRRTGKERWRSGDDPAGYATPVLVRYRGTEGLIGWTPEHVLCLDPRSGRIYWRIPYKVTYGVSIAMPLVVDDWVFVSGYWEGSKAIRLGKTVQQAELAWEENRYLRGLMAQPLYKDGYGYLLDKRHGLICFELATGKKIWSDNHRLTPRERNPQATMVWLGKTDHILALNARGELVHARLTPRGYEEFDRAPIVGKTWAHPAYAHGAVYARDDRQLVKVLLPRGK